MWAPILIATIITVVPSFSDSALLGSNNKCTYGPGYWCESIIKAKECNALNHCIQTVWTKQVIPEDNDDVCQICKNMVQEARDQLQSNLTQEELREVFEGSCRLIPIKEISEECIKLSDQFTPELIETLASEMNPQVVCATAGLCNSITVDRLLRDYKVANPGKVISTKKLLSDPAPGDCQDCKTFVADTIRLVKDTDRSETLNRLMAICGKLGTISDACMALVESNFQAIYNYLTTQLNPSEFCDLVGMCARMFGKKTVTFHKTSDETCDFCTAIVEHWKDTLTANTTEEEFKEILDGLCKHTGAFSDECLALVDSHFQELYQMLISDIHPKDICEAVGLCGLSSVFNSDPVSVWSLHNLLPQDMLPIITPVNTDKRLVGQDEVAAQHLQDSLIFPRIKLTKSSVNVITAGSKGVLSSSDDTCVMCEFTLHFLQNMLHENSTREEIEDAVDKLCTLMPRTVAEECQDYVDAYGDMVIDLLSQEIDPSVVCPMIGLCPKKKEEMVPLPNDDAPCVMCEYAMMQLKDMIKDNKTEAAIKSDLEKLCSVLPKTVRPDCKAFMDQYTDQIIQLILSDLDPDQVCIALGLCKKVEVLIELDASHQLPLNRMMIPALYDEPFKLEAKTPYVSMKQSATCVMCEFVIIEVDKKIMQNSTMDEIERAVEFACAHLPGTIQEDCIGFVEQYGDSIIRLLTERLAPKEVCQQLSLCKPSAVTKVISATVDMGIDACLVCENLVNFVDEKLEEPDTTTDIDAILDSVCTVLPQKARKSCRDIIEVYGPYFVNMLAEMGHDSKRVCQAMELCPKGTSAPLLGASKCTWGPTYWCQTKLHAKACQATTHCESKNWKTNGTPLI